MNMQRRDLIAATRRAHGDQGLTGQPCESLGCDGIIDHPYSCYCEACDRRDLEEAEAAEARAWASRWAPHREDRETL